MKRLIIAISSALIACSLYCHADPDGKTVVITAVPTNATAVTSGIAVTEEPVISGWIEAVHITFTGGASVNTCDVDIVTWTPTATGSTTGTGLDRTILSIDDVAATGTYQPRLLEDTTAGVDITGATTKIPLINDRVQVSAYGASTNEAFGIEVEVIYSHRP